MQYHQQSTFQLLAMLQLITVTKRSQGNIRHNFPILSVSWHSWFELNN